MDEDAARILHIAPGSQLRWSISGKEVQTRVACIQTIDSIHLSSRVEFIFNTSALAGFPIIYYSSLRAQPSAVPALQEALYKRFPTVTVVNVADVLQIVQGVVDRISQVVRFISMFAILAGAVILSSAVAGTRFRRMREVVILKTLGATRWRVSRIFSVEFLVLGGVAGLMGSLLAGGFANILLKRMLDAQDVDSGDPDPALGDRYRSDRQRRRLDGQLSNPGSEAARDPARRVATGSLHSDEGIRGRRHSAHRDHQRLISICDTRRHLDVHLIKAGEL